MPGATLDVRVALKAFRGPDGRPREVLRDVRFAAGPGEVLALFGPSGTGKSTLLRIVLGLDRAFEGAVARPAARPGVVFQEPLLAPWLTVAANLRLVAPLPDPALEALLAEVGLPGAGSLLPRQLSLGMARRAALARALAAASSWLVLDEPLASLDPGLAATLGGVVAERSRGTGALVLLATHELDEALAFASRVLVLAGRPATLAAALEVPRDAGERARFRTALLARFPFLAGGAIAPLPAPD